MLPIVSLIQEWQTLITGVMAIGAALIGGYFINQQMLQTALIEADRRSSEFAAERAMLPLHLDALIEHLLRCAALLKATYILESVAERTDREFPRVPMDVALFFQGVVLRSPANLREPFIEILSQLQVFHARLSSVQGRLARKAAVGLSELDEYVVQAVVLYARCLSLLPFSRRDSDEVPAKPFIAGHYMSCAAQMGFGGNEFSRIRDRLGLMVARGEA